MKYPMILLQLTSINVWCIVSSPNFCILCIWLTYKFYIMINIFMYINIPNVTAGYERFSDIIAFIFREFYIPTYINTCLKSYSSIIKLFIDCVFRKWYRKETLVIFYGYVNSRFLHWFDLDLTRLQSNLKTRLT